VTPTLDHVVVNVHRGMDEAAARYRRLGFTLTPRGYHSLGSINHLAIFGTDYLELIGLPESGGGRADLLDWPMGLNGLVWGSEDAAATHGALVGAGVPTLPPQHFTRPVEFPGGARDASFTTVRLPAETTPAGRLYFCQHFTRDLVWRDEWRAHANGCVGVGAVVVAANDPGRLGGLFARMFGSGAVRAIAGGVRLAVGLTDCDVITRAALRERFGTAAPPDDGRAEAMAALVLRTRALAEVAAAIAPEDRVDGGARIIVPAAAAFGATLAFEQSV
jgi:hypothetical protein